MIVKTSVWTGARLALVACTLFALVGALPAAAQTANAGALYGASGIALNAPSNAVTPKTATAQGLSATWIAVTSAYSGDANNNSYTTYEYSLSGSGPWTLAPSCAPGIPGESAWRKCQITGLTANTSYFVRVTFVDPDGVLSTNPQIIGPVHTKASAVNATTLGVSSLKSMPTYLLVTTSARDDANSNLTLTVDVSTSASGPWTQKCGARTNGAYQCRISGLTNGTAYFARVTASDPDGVTGSSVQVIGQATYTGQTDLALNKSITADPGWGCCSDPTQLVDGRIMYPDWPYGFANCGGTGNWGGCGPGTKKATIDLGSTQTVGHLVFWTHDPGNVPLTWQVLVSTDGINFTQVFNTSNPQCRTATLALDYYWGFPTCGQSATFAPTSARYVRYQFDDTTLFGGIHGWAVELEVFAH